MTFNSFFSIPTNFNLFKTFFFLSFFFDISHSKRILLACRESPILNKLFNLKGCCNNFESHCNIEHLNYLIRY